MWKGVWWMGGRYVWCVGGGWEGVWWMGGRYMWCVGGGWEGVCLVKFTRRPRVKSCCKQQMLVIQNCVWEGVVCVNVCVSDVCRCVEGCGVCKCVCVGCVCDCLFSYYSICPTQCNVYLSDKLICTMNL